MSLCHCLECQKRTGSAFGVAAFYPDQSIKTSGEAKSFRRTADNGHDVDHRFCPKCGSTVFWYPERLRGLVAIAVGAFADPAFPAPNQAVFPTRKHPWVTGPRMTD